MGQKFAAYSATGAITAFYDSIDSPAPEGVTTLPITNAQWQACIAAPGYTVVAGALVPPAAPALNDVKSGLCVSVDAQADAVYASIGGPSPGRLAEYQQANADASAFKSAGYAGTVPVTVSCWAQANAGWTAQQAADDIIATAAKWTAALQGIRSARLLGKAAVNAATTTATAQAAAQTAIANVLAAAEAA